MALWAFIPDKTLVSVGPLPDTARRLDTGELVADVEKWSEACGYWDLDSPTVGGDIVAVKGLTNAEFVALVAQVTEARDKRQMRRLYIEGQADDWAGAKGVDLDWLDAIPPYQVPTVVSQQIAYLYDHERRLTQQVVGIGDLVITLAVALLDALERSETFHPPGTIL